MNRLSTLAPHRPSHAAWHRVLAVTCAGAAIGAALHAAPAKAQLVATATELRAPAPENTAIRPFRIAVPEADLADLRCRVLATRWGDMETVNDKSQGVQLAKVQALVKYWGTEYDWRKVEAKLNALPQFVTTIDGVNDWR